MPHYTLTLTLTTNHHDRTWTRTATFDNPDDASRTWTQLRRTLNRLHDEHRARALSLCDNVFVSPRQ